MTFLKHMVTDSAHVNLHTTKKHVGVDAAEKHVSAVGDSDG